MWEIMVRNNLLTQKAEDKKSMTKIIKTDRKQIHNYCHKIYQSGRMNRSIASMTLAITPFLNSKVPKFKDKNGKVKKKNSTLLKK